MSLRFYETKRMNEKKNAVVKVSFRSFPLFCTPNFVHFWPPVHFFPKQNHCFLFLVKLWFTTMTPWNITISLNHSVWMHFWFRHWWSWTQSIRIWHSRLITVFICNDVNNTWKSLQYKCLWIFWKPLLNSKSSIEASYLWLV